MTYIVPHHPSPLPMLHIHVWDDSRLALDHLRGALNDLLTNMRQDHRVHCVLVPEGTATDPLRELKTLEAMGRPQLVISDLEMPVSGLVVLQTYRDVYADRCRRVLLTSRDSPRQGLRATDMGMVDTALKKPVDTTHLRAVLRLCILKQEGW